MKSHFLTMFWQTGIASALTVLGLGTVVAQDNSGKAAPTATASEQVTGKVVTPEGKPVPNATVIWIERNQDGEMPQSLTVQTNAQGTFQFDKTRPKVNDRRAVMLLVQTPGWGLSFQSLPYASRPAAPLTISVVPATALRIGFTDQTGKPLPHLPVRVFALYDEKRSFLEIPETMKTRWSQKTDAKGECVFSGLPQGVQARFKVDDERFATLSYQDAVTLTETKTQQAKPIRLLPGGIIEGRLTFAESGKPAANVRVGAQSAGNNGGWGEDVTDANGNYRLTQLSPGVYNVAPMLRGELEKNATARAIEKVDVKAGVPLKQQDIRLITGVLLTGRVTDKETGKPIEGVMLGIQGPARPQSSAFVQSTTTDAEGNYQVRVPPGEQYVYVMGIPSNRYETPEKGHTLLLTEEAVPAQNFALVPSVVIDIKPIQVHVVGQDGKPAPKAKVTFYPIGADPYADHRSGTVETDEQGSLLLEVPVTSVRLRARSGQMATEKAMLAQSGEKVTLQLKPNVLITLSGQVVDDKGKPIPSAKVALFEWWLDSGSSSGSGVPVDAQGRYTFSNLWSDSRYSFSAQAPGYGTINTRAVNYTPGEKAKVTALQLPRADSFIAGRVLDENGDPVAKQSIMLQGASNNPQTAFTDAQGRFRFDQIVKEPVTLYLKEGSRYTPKPKRALAGDRNVIMIKMPPPAPVKEGKEGTPRERQQSMLRQQAPTLQISHWINATAKMPDELEGKIVLIDFWAIGCGPCVASLPAVQKASEQFAKRGVIVIGLHAAESNKQTVQDFVKAHKLTYPIAIDTEDSEHLTFGTSMKQYNVEGIPMVVVIDRKGMVRYIDYSLEGAMSVIGNLLASEK